MYHRDITTHLLEAAEKYPVVTIIGPRQSGKTTLSRTAFPEYSYLSLEDPDIRAFATQDPRGLLSKYPNQVIFDEIQRAPELTSYLQTLIDEPSNKKKFILTGSHSGLLIEAVSQSLAGRTRVFELLPLSVNELAQKEIPNINDVLLKGGYPRIYESGLSATEWHKEYYRLYVERDIRHLTQINNLDFFEKLTRLLAGRAGQLVNHNSLSNEVGVAQPTIKAWIEALRRTYICFYLQPHHRNFNKRIIKTPKIYFFDTGLLCYLLRITQPEMLDTHPLRGAIFENFVISEMMKISLNAGLDPSLYFWRDQKGHEIDLIEDKGDYLFPTEIKFSNTFSKSFTKNIDFFNQLQASSGPSPSQIIYSGTEVHQFHGTKISPWDKFLTQILI